MQIKNKNRSLLKLQLRKCSSGRDSYVKELSINSKWVNSLILQKRLCSLRELSI